MKDKTCCFTGHRKISSELYWLIAHNLENAIIELIKKGYKYFGTGGALGFDTLAAQTVLKLKNMYPYIRLILVLPCPSQTRNWQNRDIQIYKEIKKQADKVVYVSNKYYNGCMLKRNRHLVNNSSACICFLTKETGGTAYTVKYALSNGLTVINLSDNL